MSRALTAARLSLFALALLSVNALAQQQIIITTIKMDPKTTTLSDGKQLIITPKPPDIKVTTLNTSTAAVDKSGPLCGGIVNGKAQDRCASTYASFMQGALGTCPSGSFFDIGKWQCWSCPGGYDRSLAAVDTDRACSKPDKSIQGEFGPASFKGKVCPSGSFFDPIRDGECYSCPNGYRRSLAHIDAGNACFIPGGEEFRKIVRNNKATGLFGTDCPGGQFWDGIDGYCYNCPSGFNRSAYSVRDDRACSASVSEKQAKATLVKKATCEAGEIKDFLRDPSAGGECWRCPQAWDRTVFPVNGGQACEKGGGVAFARATKVADLTCPADQLFDFIEVTAADLSAMRSRAQAANDSGEVTRLASLQPVKSGTCWQCPNGFDRTPSSVKSAGACIAKTIAWHTAAYNEPGLFGLAGADTVLLDIVRRTPQLAKLSIEKTVAKAGTPGAFEKEKGLFLSSPSSSTAASAAVFVRVMIAATEPSKASAAEKQLVDAFKAYVIAKRTYIAQDALNAYDAWYQADTYWKNQEKQKNPNLIQLLDYGTVPPDFSALALMASVGTGAGGIAMGQGLDKVQEAAAKRAAIAGGSIKIIGIVAGAALSAAGNGFGDFSDPVSAVKFVGRTAIETAIEEAANKAVEKMIQSSANKVAQWMIERGLAATLEKTAEQIAERTVIAVGSGPSLIISGGMLIASIALDQEIDIQNARPKLLASLAQAKYPPDFARMAPSDAGMTELLGYWAQATSGDSQASAAFMSSYAAAAPKVIALFAPPSVGAPAVAGNVAPTVAANDPRSWPKYFDGVKNMGPYVWQDGAAAISGGLKNAVVGGQDGTRPLALCRASYSGGMHPGKIVGNACNIGWGGKEIVMTTGFQVLVRQAQAQQEQYFPTDNWKGPTEIAQTATFYAGYEGQNWMRACRAQQNNVWHPGKEVAGKCNIGWGGKEMVLPQYQVLSLYNTAAGGNKNGN